MMAVVCLVPPVGAQSAENRVTVRGEIRADGGGSLTALHVELVALDQRSEVASSDVQLDGEFLFHNVPLGTYNLFVKTYDGGQVYRDLVTVLQQMTTLTVNLRNPANAVKMLARSILEGDPTASVSDVLERVAIIRQAADQIDALIQDLLDITRLEAGRLTVDPSEEDIGNIVTSSVLSLRPLAEAGGVSLLATLPASPLIGRADGERLSQLLSNLIGNAIKFTPADGQVSIAVLPRDLDVEFEIADSGEGIAPDQLPFVFDRFHQAGAVRRASRHGAGLGLPIARGIVEAHGGRIWIESTLGVGTTVRFTLPRTDPLA